ncbi:MAG TPA: ABC transporter permease [Gemmatimonadaceae bacterium]|nr:ABC transporter permease [Gemmatimonadaceae bacterium]
MLGLLAFRHLLQRPWRTLLLLIGYALGVAVMVVLLSIGTAMLTQARRERLVGGGQITVLPEGIDVEVMKTGGLGGMFLSIDHARFIYRQLLASPRLAPEVRAAAPQIVGKLIYITTPSDRQVPVLASGQIPSRNAAVGAGPTLAAGTWTDDTLDRQWRDPTPFELRNEIDHFHVPPASAAGDPSWAEWHYFNVVSGDGRQWAFISYIVAGQVADGRWGGQVLVTLHEQGEPARRFVADAPASAVRFSTTNADLRIGQSWVSVLPDGRYRLRAVARAEADGAPLTLDLVVSPEPGAYFPGASFTSDSLVSGYVVPALRAEANGTICVRGACERYDAAQAYHDHNWGTWRGVTWEWGAGRAGKLGVLYGRVSAGGSPTVLRPLFVYLTDSLGFLAVFRPKEIQYTDGRVIVVNGHRVMVPVCGEMTDVRGGDTLHVEIDVQDAAGTDTRAPLIERGETGAARAIARPYFIQMKGLMHVSGRVHGQVIRGSGTGFFETYR